MKQTLPREEFLKLERATIKDLCMYLGKSESVIYARMSNPKFPRFRKLYDTKKGGKYWIPREVVEHVENGV